MSDPHGKAAAAASRRPQNLAGAELGGSPPWRFRRAVRLLAAAGVPAALLAMSGLTLAGTLALLVLATPALVVFSPVLLPAAAAAMVAAAGLLLGSGLGMAAALVLLWMYAYVSRKRPRLPGADQFELAIATVAKKANDMKKLAMGY